ncbi:MAG: hypothetical protein L0338_39740 [Acidobacteria bacterium]|nr:hypothetical protein [Acidobacteriota bacterium]
MPRRRDPYTVSVDELRAEEQARKQALFDQMFGDYPSDTDLTRREELLMSEREAPEAPYTRPKRSRRREIIGSILGTLPGTQRLGERLLYEPELRAREEYELGVAGRGRREARLERNVATARAQRAREIIEPWQLRNQEALLGKTEAEIGRARGQEEAAYALAEQRRRPRSLITRPVEAGGKIKLPMTDKSILDLGEAPKRVSRFSPFGTFSPGQGIFSRETGEIKTQADPRAAARARAAAGRAANPTQARQVESSKSARLIAQKKLYDQRRGQIERDWEGIDTESPTLPDGKPNPNLGLKQNALDELNTWDTQQKNLIQRSYENELERIGEAAGETYEYPTTVEGIGPSGINPAEVPATEAGGELDPEAMRLELQEGEVMVYSPETGKYYAIPEEQLDEALDEGYEPVD